jgi:hypothetical protein
MRHPASRLLAALFAIMGAATADGADWKLHLTYGENESA